MTGRIIKILIIVALAMLAGGKIFAWSGQGSEGVPWLIQNKTDLETLATDVNNGISYSGKYFKVTASISGVDTVIGNTSAHPFCGNFDGGKRSDNDITITLGISAFSDNARGLFGYVSSGANIHDVKTDGSVRGKISGGIVGLITGNPSNVTISNCTNGATITTTNYVAGGIVGEVDSNCRNVSITGCINTNRISNATTSPYSIFNYGIGGIVGVLAPTSDGNGTVISKCKNAGTISGSGEYAYAGGIVGGGGAGVLFNILECTNEGDVSTNAVKVGGIIGYVVNVSLDQVRLVDKCINKGNITGPDNVGGIAGEFSCTPIRNCYNMGIVQSTSTTSSYTKGAGGIVGNNIKCSIDNCYNIGDVKGAGISINRSVGGIVGYNGNSSPYSYISIRNCYNGGNISDAPNLYRGGIVAYNYDSHTISYCYSREGAAPTICNGSTTNVSNCCFFSHNASNTDTVCTLSNTILGTTNLRTALNKWRTGNESLYLEWHFDISPWENLGMPRFIFCNPVSVTNFSVTPSNRECMVSWTAIGASSCKLYYGVNNPPTDGWNVNATSPITVRRLTNGRTYYFAVKPTGSGDYCEDNPPSDAVSATPNCP